MVDTLSPYYDTVKDIKNGLPKVVQKIILDNRDFIFELLKKEQLGKGLDGHGNDLVHPSKRDSSNRVPLYEPSTENYWANKEPIPRTKKEYNKRYNFDWTGNTIDNLFMFFEDDASFSMFSAGSKAGFLEIQYDTDLFLLMKEHNERVNTEILLPALNEYIERRLTSI